MNIYGVCRFSWFGVSDTGKQIETLDDAMQNLWNPARMAVRFHLFENLTLPSLAAQTDSDFKFFVLISPEMPEIYRDRLEEIVKNYPMVHLVVSAERDIRRAFSTTVQSQLADTNKAVQFRLDDDDALSIGYVAKVREIAAGLNENTAISFPKGLRGFLHDGHAKHEVNVLPFIAIGLALVHGPTYSRNIFRTQHRKLGERMPNYVDPTFAAYHHTLHTSNNTDHPDGQPSADVTTKRRRQISKIFESNPSLETKVSATKDAQEVLKSGFPFITADKLRGDLEATLAPSGLVEQFGFSGQ